jgi:hypothetical protein
MSFIIWQSIRAAKGTSQGMLAWLPVIIALVPVTIVGYCIQANKAK